MHRGCLRHQCLTRRGLDCGMAILDCLHQPRCSKVCAPRLAPRLHGTQRCMEPCWHACMGLETLGCGCVNQDICAGKKRLLLIVHERSRGTMSEARRYLCQSAQTGCRAHQLPGRLKCHTRFRSRRRAEHVAAMCRRCTCSWFGAPGIQGAWSASKQSITHT